MSHIKLFVLVYSTAKNHHAFSEVGLRISILEISELNHCAVTTIFQVKLSIFSEPYDSYNPFALQTSND